MTDFFLPFGISALTIGCLSLDYYRAQLVVIPKRIEALDGTWIRNMITVHQSILLGLMLVFTIWLNILYGGSVPIVILFVLSVIIIRTSFQFVKRLKVRMAAA